MLVGDGGPSGPQGDPLAGLQMPPGDPGPLDAAASQLNSWATELGTGAAGHRRAASAVVGSAWIGPAADRAGKSVSTIAHAAASMADAADSATSVLRTASRKWTTAISTWKQAEQLAQEALHEEQQHRTAAATALAAMSPAERSAQPVAAAQAQAGSDGSDGFVSPKRAQAIKLGQQAITDANQAITAGAGGLAGISGAVQTLGAAPSAAKDSVLDELVDGLAKTNTVIGAALTATLARAGYRAATLSGALAKAMSAADEAKVASLVSSLRAGEEPSAVAKEIQAYEEARSVATSLFEHQELDNLSSGGLKFLGDSGVARWGIRGLGGLAIIGDALTVLHPDEGGVTGRVEQGAAVANGVATAGGLGLDAAGETGAALLAANSLDWVPVAGQVVAVGTGLFLAGDYLYTHEKWFKDGVDDVGEGLKTAGEAIGHTVSSGFHDATHFISSLI